MATTRGKVLRFWNNVPATAEEPELAYDPVDAAIERPPNMEQLAKNIETARANKVYADGEAMKAESLLVRCIEAYEEEEKRRGLKCRK